MSIQRKKADDQGVQFKVKYLNIADNNMNDAIKGLKSPFINSDQQRIMQVLLNLQSNALKFTEKGKVEIHVSIVDKGEAKFLKIDVMDSGIGIKDEDKHKLFRLFGFVQDA